MIDAEYLATLYRKYRQSLRQVKDIQKSILYHVPIRAKLDDIEAELTYLLLREFRPNAIVELGAFDGWATTWILNALRDNGKGHLFSFDRTTEAAAKVPSDLSQSRWTLTAGDVRGVDPKTFERFNYLFIDANHGMRFARWYVETLLPRVPMGTPVSVHDVFHWRHAKPLSEGAVIMKWLREKQISYFTASCARARAAHNELCTVRWELGLDDLVRPGRKNPMIFFLTD